MSDVSNADAPPGKSRKYALPEFERRFLLAGLPRDARVVHTSVLSDRYLIGTRLRLRRSVESAGESTVAVCKLTQKVPAADGGPGLITTVYLSRAEYDVLAALPARPLEKTRCSIPPFAIDVFPPPLDGLTLAEVEFSSAEAMAAFATPAFALAEVTRDPRFTGGRLAQTTREELAQLLAQVRALPD